MNKSLLSEQARCEQLPSSSENYTPYLRPTTRDNVEHMETLVTDRMEVMEMVYVRLHHLPPLGYRIDLQNWKFILDESTTPFVLRMWQMAQDQVPINQIVEKITEEGFRTPLRGRTGGKPIHRSTLYDMLRDPFYAGIVRAGTRACRGFHQPLVTDEEFLKVQWLLSQRRRN